TKGSQVSRIEALHAKRQAVDARGLEARELHSLERARVRFQRHLDIRGERNTGADRSESAIDRCRRKQARRSAAKKNGRHAPSPDGRQRRFEIGDQRVDVLRLRQSLPQLVRIEIAVWALPNAPWNMNVERE